MIQLERAKFSARHARLVAAALQSNFKVQCRLLHCLSRRSLFSGRQIQISSLESANSLRSEIECSIEIVLTQETGHGDVGHHRPEREHAQADQRVRSSCDAHNACSTLFTAVEQRRDAVLQTAAARFVDRSYDRMCM